MVPHVDVLSANNYNDRFYERLNNYYDVSKMPILVGEFSWASGYFVDGPLGTALPATALKEQMQTKGRNSLKWALMHPGLVGYTWYRWVQGDPAKIPPYSYGLVYTNDETAEEHVSVVREINLNAESLRLDAGKIRE